MNLFQRLDRGRPPQAEEQPRRRSPQLERLLDWLVNHWPRPTISAAEICTYGPRPRTRDRAIELAEILVRHGWLRPLKTHRRDRREWQIVRGPTPLVLFLPTETKVAPPTIAHETTEAEGGARFFKCPGSQG
jgi:hypothetical protein